MQGISPHAQHCNACRRAQPRSADQLEGSTQVLSYYITSNIESTAVLVFKNIYCEILQTYRNKTQTTHM